MIIQVPKWHGTDTRFGFRQEVVSQQIVPYQVVSFVGVGSAWRVLERESIPRRFGRSHNKGFIGRWQDNKLEYLGGAVTCTRLQLRRSEE